MADFNKKDLLQPISKKEERKILREHKENSKIEKDGNLSSSGLTRIFGIIAIILVLVLTIRLSRYGENASIPTFRSFLEFLQGLPVIEYLNLDFGDWGWFNFLADFLEFIVNSIGWILITLLNTGRYLIRLLGWIIGVY